MDEIHIDEEFLKKFDAGLDPRRPETSSIPAAVLGYGEMSTVLEIQSDKTGNWAYKRMPMFQNRREVRDYENILNESIRVLNDEIGVRVVPTKTVWFEDEKNNLTTIYIVQKKLPSASIGNSLIQKLTEAEVKVLLQRVLEQMRKVFEYNRQHRGDTEIGFDAQISNWAVENYDPKRPLQSHELSLLYFDISSPLMRKNGRERLDSELFLRSAPSFLVWLIRLLFVDDVMNRYYDQRKVVIDLLANFYKEQRADLIPAMIETVNEFFKDESDFAAITIKEVKSYYREDAWIWRIYLAARKIDRFLHKLLRKHYPYILPEKIKR